MPNEVQALRVDEFLLGMAGKRHAGQLGAIDSEAIEVEEALRRLEVALEALDLAGMATVWWRAVGAADQCSATSSVGDRSKIRGIVVQYAGVVCKRILGEFEAALELQDRAAARSAHEHFSELRTACSPGGTQILTGGLPATLLGRGSQLEDRYRQLCLRGAEPPLCNLFPDVFSLCWTKRCTEVLQAGRPPQLRHHE